MEFIRIKNISEADFDSIVQKAGGSRIASEGSADYRLNEAIIELKLIVEEGFDKTSRQAKIAKLFREQQPRRSVVVLDPSKLDPPQSRDYYNIVAGPIKTHVKKADKQLDLTARRYSPAPTRVLVILNLGYTALTADEFKTVSTKCVHNDTTKIDFLVCGGIYFHSDKFDNYIFTRFEPIAINLSRGFPSYQLLFEAWDSFTEDLITAMMREQVPPEAGKLPVLDLAFDLDGIRYIKPAPAVPSEVFPSGRAPRENSSPLEKCPPVAIVFPALNVDEWRKFKQAMPGCHPLKASYGEYVTFQKEKDIEESTKFKPFVPMAVTLEHFLAHNSKPIAQCTFPDICHFATHRFEANIREILNRVREKQSHSILPTEYLLVEIEEIGNDEVNDLASLYHVSHTPGFDRKEILMEQENLFLNYALVVAGSYAVKRNVEFVLFSKKVRG